MLATPYASQYVLNIYMYIYSEGRIKKNNCVCLNVLFLRAFAFRSKSAFLSHKYNKYCYTILNLNWIIPIT